jgi:hypothetical protein
MAEVSLFITCFDIKYFTVFPQSLLVGFILFSVEKAVVSINTIEPCNQDMVCVFLARADFWNIQMSFTWYRVTKVSVEYDPPHYITSIARLLL